MHHQETFTPQRTASVRQCTCHRCKETPCVGVKDAALWKAILLSAPSAAFAEEVYRYICIVGLCICLSRCLHNVYVNLYND